MTPKVFGLLVFIGGLILAILCAVFIPWNGARIGFTLVSLVIAGVGFYVAKKNITLIS